MREQKARSEAGKSTREWAGIQVSVDRPIWMAAIDDPHKNLLTTNQTNIIALYIQQIVMKQRKYDPIAPSANDRWPAPDLLEVAIDDQETVQKIAADPRVSGK